MSWPGEFNNTMVRKSLDIFSSGAEGAAPAISESGLLGRAVFDFYFGDSKKPRKVHVRPPNILKLGRHCDAIVVQRWLTARGFREVVANNHNCGGVTHVEPLAVS